MKITKFAALAGAALLATAGAYAQGTTDYGLPQGFAFSNEIGSDVAKVTGNAHKDYEDTNWRSEFAGIYDKIVISYTSEKVTFNLEPKFGIKDFNENYYDGATDSNVFGHGVGFNDKNLNWGPTNKVDGNGSLNSDDLGWGYWDLGWGLKFTPFDIVSFYLHKGEDIVGSKLFARDAAWGASNLGSDGFAIITSPIAGLRISGAIPFSNVGVTSKANYMDAEIEDTWYLKGGTERARPDEQGAARFRVDLGADYTLASGLVGAGIKVNDIINAGYRQYGLYAGLNMGAIAANLGYNYSENYTDFLDAFGDGLIKIRGTQAVAGSVSFVAGDLKLMADAMYNLNKKQSVYDVYAGLWAKYDVVPGKFNADLLLGVAMDLGTNAHHGTEKDDEDLKAAMASINPAFIDLYYGHYALEDVRAVWGFDSYASASAKAASTEQGKTFKGEVNNSPAAASKNWQYYTALSRQMANGNMDTTSAAKAALAVRVKPGFTYTTGNNEFGAHVNLVNFFDGDGSYQISFPVYWKWSFF